MSKNCYGLLGTNHTWDSWKITEEGTVERRNMDKTISKIGTYFVQRRKCLVCGFTQMNRQEETVK